MIRIAYELFKLAGVLLAAILLVNANSELWTLKFGFLLIAATISIFQSKE